MDNINKLFKLINKCNIINKYLKYILSSLGILILVIIFISSFFINFDTIFNNTTSDISNIVNQSNIKQDLFNCTFNNNNYVNCYDIIFGILVLIIQICVMIFVGLYFKKYIN